MDSDLLLDIYAFLPEKYFVQKAMIPQTRISFVDYERKFYTLDERNYWHRGRLINPTYQEYGPSRETSGIYFWTINGGFYRKNGPSIVFKKPNKLEGDSYCLVLDCIEITVPRFWSIERKTKVKEMWIDHNTFIKAKVIEDGVEKIMG